MNTTLNKIRENSPCEPSWLKLLKSLDKSKADDEPVSFKYILDALGINDAVWCLRVLSYRDQCLFRADVAESVLSIFEKKNAEDNRPRAAVDAIRRYHIGEISEKELRAACAAAADADDADDASACAAADAAASSACAASAAAYASAAAAAAYAASSAAYAAAAAAGYDAREDKWKEIEQLFIKHFCKGSK